MSDVRILRTYVVMCARTYHDHCTRCNWQIGPGDSYEGTVYADSKHIWVLKEHLDCEPDPWDEEDWNSDEEGDSTPDISPAEPAELPMAA